MDPYHYLYQASRMPASSLPVSSSGTSGSSSSQGSTSGLGSSASSSSTSGIGGNGSGAVNTPNTVDTSGSTNYVDQLSRTNLYIKGLTPNTTDKDLYGLCAPYGKIISTKAILDKNTNKCKGYGFVDFESPLAAEAAVKHLQARGVQAQMAKCTDTSRGKNASVIASNSIANYAAVTSNSNAVASNYSSSTVITSNRSPQQEQDPTNLYIANLPPYMTENELESMLSPYGSVISTRILRDNYNQPRGVGFARMDSKEKCDMIIQNFNGKILPGCKEPLLVKFADGGNKKKSQNKNDNRIREGGSQQLAAYAYATDQSNMNQNGVANTQLMPNMAAAAAAAAGYHHHHHQRQYDRCAFVPNTAAAAAAIQAAAATQWMHQGAPQYHLVQPPHMQSTAQVIPSQPIDTNALHFSTLMPQLTASMRQLQLQSHPYMTGAPAAAYAIAAASGALYATQPGPVIQPVALGEPGGANNPRSGTSSVAPTDELGQSNAAHHYQVCQPK